MVNYSNQMNDAGLDQIVNNNRVRANLNTTNAQGVMWMQGTGVPVSGTGASGTTATAAQLGSGIYIWNSTAAGQTVTTDTATNILTYMNANSAGVNVGDILQTTIINGGATNSFTITGGTGVTSDSNQPTITVPANVSKQLMIRATNVTTSPAFVIYA